MEKNYQQTIRLLIQDKEVYVEWNNCSPKVGDLTELMLRIFSRREDVREKMLAVIPANYIKTKTRKGKTELEIIRDYLESPVYGYDAIDWDHTQIGVNKYETNAGSANGVVQLHIVTTWD